jgi:hypothetical protein
VKTRLTALFTANLLPYFPKHLIKTGIIYAGKGELKNNLFPLLSKFPASLF